VPGEDDELARDGDDGDLGAAAGADPTEEGVERAWRVDRGMGRLDE
jgi:hypothetical protein